MVHYVDFVYMLEWCVLRVRWCEKINSKCYNYRRQHCSNQCLAVFSFPHYVFLDIHIEQIVFQFFTVNFFILYCRNTTINKLIVSKWIENQVTDTIKCLFDHIDVQLDCNRIQSRELLSSTQWFFKYQTISFESS